MSKPNPPARKRKVAAARLGIEFQQRYERLTLARDDDEIAVAAVDLGQLFNDNVEFVIWALKKLGGLEPPNPEEIKRIRPVQSTVPLRPANDKGPLPVLPAALVEKCTCEPLEPGIIGRDRHMTSCPQYVP